MEIINKEQLDNFKNKYNVYMLTFPNNKKYVGYSANIKRRWRSPNEYSSQKLVYAAIMKYGWENIKKEILFSFDDMKTALDKEAELIENLNLLNPQNGYNAVPGGNVPPKDNYNKMSEEQKLKFKEKHREAALKQWADPEKAAYLKQRMKEEYHKSRIAKSPEERKEIWGKHNIGKLPPNAKSILQIDLNSGEIIAEYDSSRQAAFAIGKDGPASANIRRTANGQGKQAYGYGWKWKNT